MDKFDEIEEMKASCCTTSVILNLHPGMKTLKYLGVRIFIELALITCLCTSQGLWRQPDLLYVPAFSKINNNKSGNTTIKKNENILCYRGRYISCFLVVELEGDGRDALWQSGRKSRWHLRQLDIEMSNQSYICYFTIFYFILQWIDSLCCRYGCNRCTKVIQYIIVMQLYV